MTNSNAHSQLLATAMVNLPLLEEMYKKYLKDKSSISPKWREIIELLEKEPVKEPVSFLKKIKTPSPDDVSSAVRIYHLIDAYRTYGHLAAKINPIGTKSSGEPEQLKLKLLGFQPEELSYPFPTLGLLKEPKAPLLEIINALKEIYCNRIGVEYMGLQSPELESWLQERIEPNRFKIDLSMEQKQNILQFLNKSELFESFLHTKYVGQKRFSIEGGETLIPMLASAIETGAEMGVQEFFLAMAHRGRINVLSNILNKSYTDIFSEFDEGYIPDSFEGSGDVKYHKGYFSDVQTIHGHKVQVTLTANPSHLESVNPVVEGEVRARQDKLDDRKREKVLAILVHGDAALAGQGVVYETLQFFKLNGYSTGGTVHLVINNQIGFTTLPKDARSTDYCTDIAKAFGAPVFHVNAEDPEGCIYATILACQLRQKFHCDVFVDLNCYRKYGHNETDEPAFTQPLEYQTIRAKRPIRELYRDDLISQGVLEKYMAESLEAEFKKALAQALRTGKPQGKTPVAKNGEDTLKKLFTPIETGVNYKILREVAEQICSVPKGFTIHPKLDNLLKDRLSMVIPRERAKPMDWGMAELLAYGTLLYGGVDLRLAGQDSARGTFSHRHALWMDQVAENPYFPLSHISKSQGKCWIINSPLSEFAALGFEYGYSIANPEALVIWEAQFGDFVNSAQVVIDQYIASAEQKWGQKSSLCMLLPHGYEGQGPEHSSARLERFLSLAGNDNLFITNPTTPAQLFHLLRRQMLADMRKPLIVLTPKGLLRNPACVSDVKELEQGHFKEILDDPQRPKKVKKILFCTGKIFYDLKAAKEKEGHEEIAIVRLEQLYPLNESALKDLIASYSQVETCFWVQDEPQNMGAWTFISPILKGLLPKDLELQYAGRSRSASPATGSYALHRKEQAAIFNTIFEPKKTSKLDITHHFRV